MTISNEKDLSKSVYSVTSSTTCILIMVENIDNLQEMGKTEILKSINKPQQSSKNGNR